MGWRGTLRTLNAMSREAERNQKRRQREAERYHRELDKMEALEQAQVEVDEYHRYIKEVVSLHEESSKIFDWAAFTDEPFLKPIKTTDSESLARQKWEGYTPGFFVKLFGLAEKRKNVLFARIVEGQEEDQRRYQAQCDEYKDWEETKILADKVLRGLPEAYIEAIERVNPYSEVVGLGSHVTVNCTENGDVYVRVKVHGDDIIPNVVKSLLKSGKLSIKKMPKGQFYEYYQDYVCGCALRVARETLALLPVDEVYVTAEDNLLNTATGHVEEQPILSVRVPRLTCEQLNFEALDPSDAMSNFVHNMDFKKTKGFSPVAALEN
ncbi:hypothetical protein [Magnetovibrio sp.]|uniref:hypothetical protein n=1 Tax=Magnetovibrio sp. TaxID=2024836 RepID=UPI002F94E7CA